MLRRILFGLALLAGYPAAAASVIYVDINTSVGLKDTLWISDNGTNVQLYFAGGMDLTVAGYATRLVYCVDLDTNINVPGTYNAAEAPPDTAALERVGWLMQHEWPSEIYTQAALQMQAAAFQLAIWDIVSDGGDGFGTATTAAGKVSQSTDAGHPTDPAVLAAAMLYESDSVNMRSAYGTVYYTSDAEGVRMQTLMGQSPEPANVILILSGLAMIGVGSLRSRRSRPR